MLCAFLCCSENHDPAALHVTSDLAQYRIFPTINVTLSCVVVTSACMVFFYSNCLLRVDAAIVRIMKTHRKLKHDALVI